MRMSLINSSIDNAMFDDDVEDLKKFTLILRR